MPAAESAMGAEPVVPDSAAQFFRHHDLLCRAPGVLLSVAHQRLSAAFAGGHHGGYYFLFVAHVRCCYAHGAAYASDLFPDYRPRVSAQFLLAVFSCVSDGGHHGDEADFQCRRVAV